MKTPFYLLASIALAMVIQYVVMMVVLGPILQIVHLISSGGMAGDPPHWSIQSVMLLLGPLVAAAILVNLKWIHRPWLTAPLGSMALYSLALFTDRNSPWWIVIAVLAINGILSLAGCFLGSQIARRRRKEVVASSAAVE